MKDKKEIKQIIVEVEKRIKEGVEYIQERAYLEGVFCALLWAIDVKLKLKID